MWGGSRTGLWSTPDFPWEKNHWWWGVTKLKWTKGTEKEELARGDEMGRMASGKMSEECVLKRKFSTWKLAWTPQKVNNNNNNNNKIRWLF